jgi:hypothetical protein
MISLVFALVVPSAVSLPPLPPVIDPAACDDPAQRSQIVAQDGAIQQAFDRSRIALDIYNSQKEAEMDERLAALNLPPKERARFALSMLEHPRFAAAMAESGALIQDIMTQLTTIMGSTDEIANCRAAAKISALSPAIFAKTDAQWTIMAELVADEAARRQSKEN